MRALTFAAIVGVGVTVAGVAAAGPWNDPAGRVNFTAPSGWVSEQQHSSPQQTVVLTGSANDECYVISSQNAGTAAASASRVHALTDPMASADWQTLANSIRPMFPHGNASVTSQTVDTSTFWPIQRAELAGAERPVTAALTHRPGGLDLIAMCWTYGGPDATATYEAFFHTLANANDATWQATAEQQTAAAQAAQAAHQQQQAAAPQQAAQQAPDPHAAAEEARRRRYGEGAALTPH